MHLPAAFQPHADEQGLGFRLRGLSDPQRASLAEMAGEFGAWTLGGLALATPFGLFLLGRAMEKIPSDYRDVILLQTVEGLSRNEIAELLEKSEGSVRMLLSRARTALALEIERLARSKD